MDLPADMIDKLVQHSIRFGREIRDQAGRSPHPSRQGRPQEKRENGKRRQPTAVLFGPSRFARFSFTGAYMVFFSPINSSLRSTYCPDVAGSREIWSRASTTVFRFTRSAWSWPMAADWRWFEEFSRAGKKIFLDLKLHDIATTVARATARSQGSARACSPSTPIRRRCRPRASAANEAGGPRCGSRRHRAYLL